MSESEKGKTAATENDVLASSASGPLVFISHDTRDADLAEAFSKLLKSVSAGMLKSFRSSDKKGTDGIDFGDEWYKRLMSKLQSTSDDPSDPVGILMAASMIKDDVPWLYELAMEVYRAVKSGDPSTIEQEMHRLRRFSEFMMQGPFMEEMGFGDRDSHMILMEFPHMLSRLLERSFHEKKPHPPARRLRLPKEPG